MRHETTTGNGEPAICVRLDYEEAREYLALDEEAITLLDSLAESERDEMLMERWLAPLTECAEEGAAGLDAALEIMLAEVEQERY